MNADVCGIGRCRDEPDAGSIWQVPICEKHWNQCCHDGSGGSLGWLHKHAKKEFIRNLPKPLPPPKLPRVATPEPVARQPRVAKPTTGPRVAKP